MRRFGHRTFLNRPSRDVFLAVRVGFSVSFPGVRISATCLEEACAYNSRDRQNLVKFASFRGKPPAGAVRNAYYLSCPVLVRRTEPVGKIVRQIPKRHVFCDGMFELRTQEC
jgi:hypothetical protein